MAELYVDADACPVKKEIYRVAKRHGMRVTVVANAPVGVPEEDGIAFVLVSDRFDAADDWIVAHAGERDIVVTDDIPLAARCLEKGALALGSKGNEFTADSIGEALANREFSYQLREHGLIDGSGPPYLPKDRSRFLNRLDILVRRIVNDGV